MTDRAFIPLDPATPGECIESLCERITKACVTEELRLAVMAPEEKERHLREWSVRLGGIGRQAVLEHLWGLHGCAHSYLRLVRPS